MMASISERVVYEEHGDGLDLLIATKKHRGLLIFVPFWWAGWTAGGIFAVISLVTGESFGGFLVLWLVFWAVAWLVTGYAWLWSAFGQEIVRVRLGTLSIKRDVFGYGPVQQLPLSAVSRLRAAGLFGNLYTWSGSMVYWGLSGRMLAFESQGKTHRFGPAVGGRCSASVG